MFQEQHSCQQMNMTLHGLVRFAMLQQRQLAS
jgi:hypothetical protein